MGGGVVVLDQPVHDGGLRGRRPGDGRQPEEGRQQGRDPSSPMNRRANRRRAEARPAGPAWASRSSCCLADRAAPVSALYGAK